ncbi:DUF935 domain-containing protein, partial [Pandoraea anapnoica]
MGKIVDMNGVPFERKALTDPQSSRVGWLRQTFPTHPTRGMTPTKLYQVLDAAERGHLREQADLGMEMEEKDGHIAAEMSKRKRALLTLDYDIQPPKNATAAEQKLTEEVREWIMDMPYFEDLLLDCMDALGQGFSPQEIEWSRLGKLWYPKAFHHRPQGWFMNPPDNLDEIRLCSADMAGEPLWPGGWIVHRHRAKSGYIARCGLHRVLAWTYLFKNYSARDLGEFLEIHGLPMRIGKYGSGATDAEKDDLFAAIVDLGHNAAAVIPQEMEIDFKDAADGSHQPFMAMIGWCESTQSKVILGGTLTSQADGKSSTNALGNVHNEVRHDLLTSDARQIERTITRELILPMILINRGGISPLRCPRLVFETQEPEDMAAYADALPKLVSMGLTMGVDFVREKLSIPAPKPGEAVLTVP